ncbi:hypothetical protein B0H15DRAFT_809535 [Mycena belliarum]|uniref:Uncharacterized protein n=1 Tax=Mycena belliarum TaxID=1033014 RepID=A0AAD6XYE5_9AGAR|nr:hypothetical protein B0H15DRAFT_809535 [Mycena belliae]
MWPATFALFCCSLLLAQMGLAVEGHTMGSDAETPDPTVCVYDRRTALERRADGDGNAGAGGGVGVALPSVGLTLGNITTKLGNINLTVTNVTISVGNIEIENIEIGNITIIVSVPLPGASPINAFSASSAGTSISTSTGTGTSTVSPPTSATQTASARSANFLQRHKRQDASESATITTSPALPSVTVGGGDVSAGAGNIDTEIGNITIFVGNVNVSIGNVNISNVTVGNIFVLVQIGQPDV